MEWDWGPFDMLDLKEAYVSRRPALQRAEAELERLLQEVVAKNQDKTLVRAEVRKIRIKELPSLEKKRGGVHLIPPVIV